MKVTVSEWNSKSKSTTTLQITIPIESKIDWKQQHNDNVCFICYTMKRSMAAATSRPTVTLAVSIQIIKQVLRIFTDN